MRRMLITALGILCATAWLSSPARAQDLEQEQDESIAQAGAEADKKTTSTATPAMGTTIRGKRSPTQGSSVDRAASAVTR